MRGTVLAARRRSIVRSSRSAGFNPRPLKNLFTANGRWAGLLEVGGLRAIEVDGRPTQPLARLRLAPLVFTLPDILWPLFYHNRDLLNNICRLAVDNLLYGAQKRGLQIGIFCAIHTYGLTGTPMGMFLLPAGE